MTKSKKKTAHQMRQHPRAAKDGEIVVEHLTNIIIARLVNSCNAYRGGGKV